MAENRVGDLPSVLSDIQDLAEGVGELSQSLPGLSAWAQAVCNVAAGTPFGELAQIADIGTSCTPYWNAEGITPPSSGPPFLGGQCPGEQYRANLVTATYDLNGMPVTVGVGGVGIGPGPLTFESGEGFQRIRAAVGGVLASIDITSIPGATNLRDVQFNVVTDDGSPDDCGNPPDVFTPSPEAPGDGFDEPQTIQGPDGRDYTVTPREWSFDLDGNLDIPFEINGNEFNFGPQGEGSPEGPTAVPDLVVGPDISGSGDEGQRGLPAPPSGFIYVAIRVTLSGFDLTKTGTVVKSAPNARFYAPQGNADILVASSDNMTGYVQDRILNSRQNILAIPVEGLRIVAFRVNTVPGVSYTVTPILRPIPTEE